MTTYRKPGVYVEGNKIFPPDVTEVETAVPAFIGYTQIAKKAEDNDLILKPVKIYSLKEYESFFGYPQDDLIKVTVTGLPSAGFKAVVEEPSVTYLMYYSLKMFFDNGGKKCYIVSTGLYSDMPAVYLHGGAGSDSATRYGLQDGLNAVALEEEPSLLVFPESIKLTAEDYGTLVQAALAQCEESGNRFCIFDIYDGDTLLDTMALQANRSYFGNNNLSYGAAYYPFLKTSINFYINPEETNVVLSYGISKGNSTADPGGFPQGATLGSLQSLNGSLYNFIRTELQNHFVALPAGGAVAGVYAAVDTAHGVWKAPANVSLAGVKEPVIKIDEAYQGELNIDAVTGKSINAIRSFAGKGTLIWGARTLAGNDNEWRYIPVRRFFCMVEESVKKSTSWAVFEPNDANTWLMIRNVIENYLTQKWLEGALIGATSREAFFVQCGLGTTMNEQDTTEGRVNVMIGMAVIRAAEFILFSFSHKLQPS